jgi:polysaccharide chain length determinant protein (PEP-CTERM system associated)
MDLTSNPAVLVVLDVLTRLRRWWSVPVVGLCLGVAFGFLVYDRLPKTYEARTVILVKPPLISRSVVPTPVSEDIVTHLRALAPVVLSREYLATLTEGIYGEEIDPSTRESLMMGMRERITIPIPQIDPRLETGTFELLFEDRDPELSAKVVNRLADMFIEEYVRDRTEDAKEVVARFSTSVETEEEEYLQQELAIQRFRARHRNELAETQSTNQAMLTKRSDDLDRIKEDILAAEQRLSDLQARRRLPITATGGDQTGLTEYERVSARVAALRDELQKMLLVYTELHPSVETKRNELAAEERKLAALAEEAGDAESGEAALAHPLDQQIATIEREIDRLRREQANIEDDIREFERRLQTTVSVEQELAELEKGFAQRQDTLEDLRGKLDMAEMSLSLQESRGRERFQILDKAQPPVFPKSPDQLMVMTLSIGAGLAIFAGPLILMQLLRPIVQSKSGLENVTGVPVLVAINEIGTRQIRRRRRARASWNLVGALAGLAVVLAVALERFGA